VRGQVRKLGRSWAFAIEVGEVAVRRCTSCKPKARGKHKAAGKVPSRGTRFRVEDLRGRDDCPLCHAPLGPVVRERAIRWRGGFATKKAAEHALHQALGRLDAGDDPIPEAVTVAAFFERWLEHLAAQDKPRPRVRAAYERLIRAHVLPMIGGLELRKVRPAHCQSILDAYCEGRAARTVAQLRAAMSSMFAYAVRGGLVSVNSVRATKAPTPRPPQLVTPDAEQLRALIEAAVGTTWEVPVLIAATTGARRGEVLGLRWRDVDLDRGRVGIVEAVQRIGGQLIFTPPKTPRAVRQVPLPAFVVERLRRHKADQAARRLVLGAAWADFDLVSERGDGRPLDPDALSHGFVRLARAAGLDGVRLHDLRHGVATMLAKARTPAYVTSKVLGHSSPAFTASVYQHADDESVERALRGIEDALGPS
jgi:integrase